MPTKVFRALAYPLMLLSALALVVALVPGLGQSVNGAQRWISFGGPFQLQPSEPAKLALILWGADLLARKEKLRQLTEWRQLLIPLLPGAGVLVMLVMLGNDLGTTLVLLTIFLSLLWVVGAPGRLFVGMAGVTGVLVAILIVVEPYRMQRLTGFLDQSGNQLDINYQGIQGLYAIASGGWFGTGLGEGRAKWNYLPHPETDFIFAIIGEELGLIGTLVVLGLFGLLAYAGPADRAAGQGPVHAARGGRRDRLAGRPGHRQHRRGDRRPAHYGHPTATGVVRWISTDPHADRSGHAVVVRQARARRPAGPGRTWSGPGRAGPKLAGPGEDAEDRADRRGRGADERE